jgi:hypothetical protein
MQKSISDEKKKLEEEMKDFENEIIKETIDTLDNS